MIRDLIAKLFKKPKPEIKRFEPRYVSWSQFKEELETLPPWTNTPYCNEHYVQFQNCMSMHTNRDLKIQKQINEVFNKT
jgi:hypothetical protein